MNDANKQLPKVRKWLDILKRNQDNLEYMTDMQSAYEASIDNFENDKDYIKIANKVYDLEKLTQNEIKRVEKEVTALENKKKKDLATIGTSSDGDDERIAFKKIIEDEGWYHSRKDNKFFRRENKGVVEQISWYPMDGVFKGRVGGLQQWIWWEVMDTLKRMKDGVINSAKPNLPEKLFNAVDMSRWVKPAKKGVEDVWMKILINSLANGDPETKDYIEHIICYKYLHPEEIKLPVLWFYGEGGAGKNLFVESVLATLFSQSNVATVGGRIFDGFNGQLLGKVVVFLDEVKINKTEFNLLKSWTWNKTLNVNIKYCAEDSYENTILWIAGGNGFDSAPPLGGDTSDRRWAPIRVDKNIMEYVGEEFELEYNKQTKAGDAVDYFFNVGEKRYEDKQVISQWLSYIIEKHGTKEKPQSMYNEDFEEIVKAHESSWKTFLNTLYEQETFFEEGDAIPTSDIHEVYSKWMKKRLKSGSEVGFIQFSKHLHGWVREYRIPWKQVRVKIGKRDVKGWAPSHDDREVITMEKRSITGIKEEMIELLGVDSSEF